MPSTASTTLIAQARSSRSANILVKTGGMCWTTRTGTARVAGSRPSTLVRASGPPVEEAMVSAASRPVRRGAGAGTRAGVGRRRPPPSEWIFGMSCSRTIRWDSAKLPAGAERGQYRREQPVRGRAVQQVPDDQCLYRPAQHVPHPGGPVGQRYRTGVHRLDEQELGRGGGTGPPGQVRPPRGGVHGAGPAGRGGPAVVGGPQQPVHLVAGHRAYPVQQGGHGVVVRPEIDRLAGR